MRLRRTSPGAAAPVTRVRVSLAVPCRMRELSMAAAGGDRSGPDDPGDATGPRLRQRPYDLTSFESVYEAWFGEVLRWIRALGAPAADHDDILQDVFVVVHRRLPHFDGRNLPGWLYRITAHQVRDHRRLRWVRTVMRRGVPLSAGLEAPEPTPLMALETRERRDLIERLLDRLSEPLRVTFMLFEVEGYTAEEIAKLQRVPANTVRARIHRARKRMLKLLTVWRDNGEGGKR